MDSLISNLDPALITALVSDPEISALLARPDMQQKMQMFASNPERISQFMNDPDFQRLMQKLQSLGLNPNSMMGSAGPSLIPNPWAPSSSSSTQAQTGTVVEILSKSQFDTIIRSNPNKLIAVDFTASWCPPCKFIFPHFNRFASKHSDHGIFLKVDVDKNRDIATDKRIQSMPTFQFYMDGAMVAEFSGADQDRLENTISLYIDRLKQKINTPVVIPSPYKHIPLKSEEIASFQQCKFEIIKEKLIEFNNDTDNAGRLSNDELQIMSSLIDLVADRKSFHRSSISDEQKQLIMRILQSWRSSHLPPLLNLLRMAVFHSSLEPWITVQNLSLMLRSCDTSDDCRLTALRMICNLFARVSYRMFLIDNFDSILDSIRSFFSSPISAIRFAYIGVLINYAIIFCDDKMLSNSNAQSGKIQLLSISTDALQSVQDEKIAQRLLIISGTLLYRDSTLKSIGQSLQLNELCVEIKARFQSVDTGEMCSEVMKSLNDEMN